MFKPKENSLFAILLRSQWWVSALVAVAAIGLIRLIVPTLYAVAAALPFIVIALYVGWRELREPSGRRVARTLEALRAMNADEFAGAMEAAFRGDGYAVKRLGGQADFELERASRNTLVVCKRWKATRTGVEPLRELDAARKAREAHECIYVAAGEITGQARAFAAEKNIRLIGAVELAKKVQATQPKIGVRPQ
jgi:restriction system protein